MMMIIIRPTVLLSPASTKAAGWLNIVSREYDCSDNHISELAKVARNETGFPLGWLLQKVVGMEKWSPWWLCYGQHPLDTLPPKLARRRGSPEAANLLTTCYTDLLATRQTILT